MNILFVCSGNTCRSPLAVAAWHKLERESADITPAVSVDSAGAFASEGASVSRHAVAVAEDWNYDLSTHRAKQLQEQDVRQADLICTMTQSQADVLRARFPADAFKILVLGQWSGKHRKPAADVESARLQALMDDPEWTDESNRSADIMDPYGGSMEAYRSCAQQIEEAIVGLRAALPRNEVEEL